MAGQLAPNGADESQEMTDCPRDHRARRAAAVMAAVVVLAVPACGGPDISSGHDPLANASTITTVPPTVEGGAGSCEPGSPVTQLPLGLEVKGVLSGTGGAGEFWALFQDANGVPLQGSVPAVTDLTVYWRIEGDHALNVTLVGPNDRLVDVEGEHPQPLEGWTEPGEPWVSSFAFPQPGCWRLFVERGGRHGDVWVRVV